MTVYKGKVLRYAECTRLCIKAKDHEEKCGCVVHAPEVLPEPPKRPRIFALRVPEQGEGEEEEQQGEEGQQEEDEEESEYEMCPEER